MMAQYIVEQRQIGGQCWIVEAAKSMADAIRQVRNGDGVPTGFEITSTGAYTAYPVHTDGSTT
jgi:hypothetical protein